MKRNSVIHKIFAFALTAIVIFTVTVRETHYLFHEHHAQTEHCENHLHQADTHTDCSVCKFDVSFFTDTISYPDFACRLFSDAKQTGYYLSIIYPSYVISNSLRGPPALI